MADGRIALTPTIDDLGFDIAVRIVWRG